MTNEQKKTLRNMALSVLACALTAGAASAQPLRSATGAAGTSTSGQRGFPAAPVKGLAPTAGGVEAFPVEFAADVVEAVAAITHILLSPSSYTPTSRGVPTPTGPVGRSGLVAMGVYDR